MTAVAAPGTARRHASRSWQLAGTGTLLRLAVRRDRVMLPVWVVALGLTVMSTASAFRTLYDTASGRAGLARSTNASGSLRALYGPVLDDAPGGLVAWRMVALGGVFAAVMSVVVVVRHTREEEESGRQELLSSAVVGRRAPLTAALLTALAANVLVALLVAAGLAGLGLPGGGALALGLAIGGAGLCFAGVAAVAAQLTESARAAKGIAGAVLGAAFVLRAAGDAARGGASSPLVWVSPVGWGEEVRAFAGNRWWVLLLPCAAAAVTAAAAYALAGRRDLGAGLLADRPGAAAASRRLAGAYGLAWRLQRGSLLGWALAFAVAGGVFGAITDGATELVGDNDGTREIFARMGGHQGITEAFLSSIAGVLGMVAALYAVGSVLRLRAEETGGRAEPVLAGAVSRLRWAAGHLAFAFLGTAAVLAAGGLGMGLGYGLAAGDVGGQLPRVLGAVLAQAPAAWVPAGLAVLVFGAVPQVSAGAWAAAGVCLAIGWLGPVLKLPGWVMGLSPFGHLPKLPGAVASAVPFVWLTALAAALTCAGLVALRRRDLG
ncbi:ABC transporter permease [Streptomyces cinnamoneus]|uniref:ABC transporter membrane-spanning protein n=1 Tax=Streptomyces cinnamoneus TaxID=53446 RepID=A0A918U3C1_STRCJ|nr:ABC transporter permease [Streptomyces cinnamoneus]GHC71348.1 ABC transporter membrane-spanning protein [Streptomyces cinnamoneus]